MPEPEAGCDELAAVMARDDAERALGDGSGEVRTVPEGALAAILVPATPLPRSSRSDCGARKTLGLALVERQRLFEHLLGSGDLLPAPVGIDLDGPAARRLLAGNADLLSRALARHAGERQYQIEISCEPGALRRRRAPANPAPRGRRDWRTRAFGAGVDRSERSDLAELVELVGREIASAVADLLLLPRAGEGVLLNLAVLVPRAGLPALETRLEAIDGGWDGLRIRLIGPMPPVSFAALMVERLDDAALAAARLGLGLPPDDADADPVEAHRRLVLAAGRDPGAPALDMGALGQARDVLRRHAAARTALVAAGLVAADLGAAAAPVDIVRLRRDDTAACMAGRRTAA